MATRNSIPFSTVLEALLDESRPFHPKYLHQFSDIEADDFASLQQVWPKINNKRKVSLLEDLEELEAIETTVQFHDLAVFALQDNNPTVRVIALRILWESPDVKLVHQIIDLMERDPDPNVRAEAAKLLGIYVYKGELEELPQKIFSLVKEKLLKCLKGSDGVGIKQCALEALGYSMDQEVHDLVKMYFETKDRHWIRRSLAAMGRSADSSWEKQVMSMLHHPDPEISYEAIQAAGELELSAAREPLLDMLSNFDDLDEDIKVATVTALSHIGGESVRESLQVLLENPDIDEDLSDLIEESLEYLDFSDSLPDLSLLELTPQDEDDLYLIEDLSETRDNDESD